MDINAESLEFDIASLLGRIVSYIFVWNQNIFGGDKLFIFGW